MLPEKILSHLCILLLIICCMAPLRKTKTCQKSPFLRKILKHHTIYGILLFIFAFIHGILAGKQPRMITGKLAWLALFFLIILALPKKRMQKKLWMNLHIALSILSCFLVLVHISYVLL